MKAYGRVYIMVDADNTKVRFDVMADKKDSLINDVKKKVLSNIEEFKGKTVGLSEFSSGLFKKFQFTKERGEKGNIISRYEIQRLNNPVDSSQVGADLVFLVGMKDVYYVDLKKHKISDNTNLREINMIRPMEEIYNYEVEATKFLRKKIR